jgi:hypothetical protein
VRVTFPRKNSLWESRWLECRPNKPYVPMLRENNVRKGSFEREQFEAVRRQTDCED